jgi:hypothetical protein
VYQRELYILPTHTEEPDDSTISSGVLPIIECRCHQVFLQPLHVSFEISCYSSTIEKKVLLLRYRESSFTWHSTTKILSINIFTASPPCKMRYEIIAHQ